MSKEKTVQKATKKEPAKSLKEKQADKKVKKKARSSFNKIRFFGVINPNRI
jgi:CRISPR/Cas system type I-B associated protein Csh2 (Cas7 group RAMP superfamily)